MTNSQGDTRRRITIAIMALGGQGGGVLADWIITMATCEGYVAQGTSVPGVAQRTGATIYYLELCPRTDAAPVLALSPTPGDVDIVVAAELMEAGRAMLRGFVDRGRTALIASTHRVYAISEKSAMGDGLGNRDYILDAARTRARSFTGFDMEQAAGEAECAISAVLFGALAQSGALPFARESFEAAIRDGAIAVEANLRGFASGLAGKADGPGRPEAPSPPPTSPAGRALQARIEAELPRAAHGLAHEGVRRLMDYQDADYASHYLDRLHTIAAADTAEDGSALTCETARHLALWMSYEDTIRVADLKTRRSRVERVHGEVRARAGQVVHVTEFMHPRLQEVCETMPAWLGRRILNSKTLSALLVPLFRQGRHVTSTRIRWFLILRLLAGLRVWRRGTLRFVEEQARIESWLALLRDAAQSDRAMACELARCQQLIKGYGDTFARGLRNFELLISVYRRLHGRADGAAVLRALREAALKDEDGQTLATTLAQLEMDAAAG